jgi:hypothetical protein
MTDDLDSILAGQGGVATTAQLLTRLGRAGFESRVAHGELVSIWTGIYARTDPSLALRLAGMDLRAGRPVAVCLGTAAAAYGFDTENNDELHVLNPAGHQLRSGDGLIVHRRDGAPLTMLSGRPITEPAWTAVEVARALRRARALATLDAALRSRTCDRRQLRAAAARQAGRRGIVAVRELIPLATPQAESPMESEARLAMLDGGLPAPVLQYSIVDYSGRTWRVDFAWPDQHVAVEYDGFDYHSDPRDFRRDRQKRAALREVGWTLLSIVADDVRRRPAAMVRQIGMELTQSRRACVSPIDTPN